MSDGRDSAAGEPSAFYFHGNWRDFLPIALTNLGLTIITLGIYRFWATTRERQYLWSKTRFIDEDMEYTGTGKELLIGFVMVLVTILLPFLLIQFAAQAMALQGYAAAAGLLTLATFLFAFYLGGVARFRAVRYRLSRTYWHGIRGGSNDPGLSYGLSYIWKSIAGYIPFGLLIPWSMVSLWNERWNKMSFGPYPFKSDAKAEGLLPRFLLFYISPIIMFFGVFVMGLAFAGVIAATGAVSAAGPQPGDPPAWLFIAIVPMILAVYLVIPAIWLVFYAKFYRTIVDRLSLHTLDFDFVARTKNWLMLYLGDAALWIGATLVTLFAAALVIIPLGLMQNFNMPQPGQVDPAFVSAMILFSFLIFVLPFALVGPFIRYRHWKFLVNNMRAYGEVNLDQLTQSQTVATKHGEGLLDAFDVGAI